MNETDNDTIFGHCFQTWCNLTALSLNQIWPTLPPNALFMVFGAAAALFSLITLFVIAKSSKLRKIQFFRLLSVSVICDLVLGVTYVLVGSRRYYRYFTGRGEVMTVWQCFGEFCVNTFALILSLSMAVVLVLDRLVAVSYPILYKQQACSKRLILPLILSAFLYAGIQILVHLFDAISEPDRLVLTCSLQSMTRGHTLDGLITVQLITSCTVVGLNGVLGILIKLRSKKKSRRVVGVAETAIGVAIIVPTNEIDTKIFKTITVMTISHAVAHLGTRLCQLIAITSTTDESIQIIIYRYTRCLVVLNSAVHFFLLLATSGEFRKAARNIV